ncbi:TPA: hypothetical protein N0F65_011014 [Lagenidium giganteum]|uniref:ABC transporter domain-containing protein n=1 Tax=Lagenidium giganteum TaxID=4803 RepID=A0AAV2Z752_9STRA|nr:TPA: hypothetical protein N0F65_011014 [Lagenidium giganteum]
MYGSVAVPAVPSLTAETHPERTCSWFSWLFMLFHEELFCQKHPPPAPWRRLFTRHSPRMASIDDVVPLPLEWQCAAAKRSISAALTETHGDVAAALMKMDRPEVLRAHAWSLASGVFKVVYAVALMQLLGAVTSSDDDNRVRRVTALVLCVIVARVAESVAREHRSLASVHVKVRAMSGLLQLLMERAVRVPWVHLVGEESEASPGVCIRELHKQVERVYAIAESTRNSVGDVVSLGSSWFLLECVLARLRWQSWQRMEAAHPSTVRALNEFFKWAFPVKLYAWESKMLRHIMDLRSEEERAMNASQRNDMVAHLAWMMSSVTILGVLKVLSWHRVPLTAFRVFAIALFVQPVHSDVRALLHWLHMLPHDKMLDRFVAPIERATLPAKWQDSVAKSPPSNSNDQITAKNAVICVNRRLLLVNVSFQVQRGELAIIHGPAGVGKSTILRMLSGEQVLSSGSVVVPPDWHLAYCAQENWLRTGTIRDNILFGSLFDQIKYQRVLDACGLLDDLERLADGDGTYIGPRGANLSGGQKARVALARACYADADLYLLDCTLDCVDPLVQQEVFDKCICNLLRDKTVIMVTQNPELASSDWADRRLDVLAARIVETPRGKGKGRAPIRSGRVPTWRLASTQSVAAVAVQPVNSPAWSLESDAIDTDEWPKYPSVFAMVQILSHGTSTIAQIGLLVVVLLGLTIGLDSWLAAGVVNSDGGMALTVYMGVVLGSLLALLSSTWLALIFVENFSSDKFRSLVTQMTKASLRFFNDVQHGELSYPVWGALFDIEQRWLWCFHITMRGMTEMASRVVLMVWAVGAGAAVFLAIAVADWWYLVNNVTSRDEMLVVERARVQHEDWLLEISGGLSFVRLLGKEKQDTILQQYSERVNAMSTLLYTVVVHNSYTLVRFALAEAWPLLTFIYVTAMQHNVEPSVFGLLLYCAVTLPRSAVAISTGITNISCDLISVKHIDSLTALARQFSEERTTPTVMLPSSTWPTKGEVRFENVTFKYSSRVVKPKPVLRDVTFAVNGGEKIGLVGRTGSGKTSVAMALFRIDELSTGRIVVDGVDIGLLGLQELRSRLSIIPQSPVFYRCSVRSYLDPFGDFDDVMLWCVLQTVGLAGSGIGQVATLDDMLAEDAVNWSAGERQLLSLARSLLKPSKVLVLDEAFSSLEQERDDAVLSIVHSEFASSTVFLITHRMDQVLGFDRILVMDDGRAVEMGSVGELLSNPDSRFYELLESSPLMR